MIKVNGGSVSLSDQAPSGAGKTEFDPDGFQSSAKEAKSRGKLQKMEKVNYFDSSTMLRTKLQRILYSLLKCCCTSFSGAFCFSDFFGTCCLQQMTQYLVMIRFQTPYFWLFRSSPAQTITLIFEFYFSPLC